MAEVRLTKNELRAQQIRLVQLERYLPTLQLKKAMLQLQVQEAHQEVEREKERFEVGYAHLEDYGALFSAGEAEELFTALRVKKIQKSYENIAGVEVPSLVSVEFEPISYSLLDTPVWADSAVEAVRKLTYTRVAVEVAIEKEQLLEHELREVSIRVNLFEKILIPRALRNIKKIRVFLGDQELAAVSRAKVAKAKIEERRMAHEVPCG